MAQLVIRNIENEVKVRLQRRAKRHGRSMEEEVREILRNAVIQEVSAVDRLGTDISALFARVGLDTDIAELQGHEIEPISLNE